MRAARLGAQGLTAPLASTPEVVVGRLLAIQAQDLRAAKLAVRVRSAALTANDVDAALTERQTLVVGWLNRATLHLVATEDYWWLHALTAPRHHTMNATRLRQEGVSEAATERGVELIADLLRQGGPQTRDQVRAHLDAAGVPTKGQALVHLLLAASLAGHAVRGPVVGTEQAFAFAPSWIGPRPAVDRPEALARLAGRYLVGHGPAGARDLARWAGITLGDARNGLAAIADDTEPCGDEEVRLAADPVASDLPPPRLLGGFDPVLHGWASRTWVVPRDSGVVTTNGIFRPTALVDGRVVATWTFPSGTVHLSPVASGPALSSAALAALADDAEDVRRFLRATDA